MTQPVSKPSPTSIPTKPVVETAPIMHARMDELAKSISELRNIVLENHEAMRREVSAIREDVDTIKEWRSGASDRVRQVSQSDLEQAAQLGQERAAREDLAKKVDALAKVNERQLEILSKVYSGASSAFATVAAHPLTKLIILAMSIAITAWLARHGVEVPK